MATAALAVVQGTLPAVAQSANASQQESSPVQNAGGEALINPDRPGLADGSTVIGRGRFQLEAGLQQDFRRDGASREQTLFVPTLMRVGVSRRWEARVEGNTLTRVRTLEPGMASQSASFAPVSFGFKAQLQDAQGARRPALGMIFRAFPAYGGSELRSQHVTGDLRLAADWYFAPKFSLNPNLGVARATDDRGKTFAAALWALTLNYLPTNRLNPFIDFGLQAPEEKRGKTSVIFDAGVAYIAGRNVQVDATIGQAAHGRTPPRPFVAVGLSFRSGSFERKRPPRRTESRQANPTAAQLCPLSPVCYTWKSLLAAR